MKIVAVVGSQWGDEGKGKIVESGKHEKLLDQNKIYADLWNVQVGI